MSSLSNYEASSGNWREQLRRNERKTMAVISVFVAIYLCLGLFADLVINKSYYPNASLEQLARALLTFHLIPYATLAMIAVAIIALLITYSCYDRIMLLGTDSHEITPETANNLQEKQLYNVVEEMKVAAGLRFMPKVYLIEADYMNAFASGYSEKSAMVAITKGLLNKLDRAELQAVMSHELSHIRHHDIKLTLMVAVLSNILLIVMDLIFYSMLYERNKREDNRLVTILIILRYLLPLLTLILGLFLSRTRELMADAGAVELMRDNQPMARALMKINQDHAQHAEQYKEAYGKTAHEQLRQASYLFDPSNIDPMKSFQNAFSTHPSLEQRLRALGFKRKS